jgi:hypothetical protein
MDKMNEVFDLIPVEVITKEGKSITVVEEGDENEDHTYARARHYELAEKGSEALDIAMKIARATENPRSIEVLSGLIKNLSEVNKSLLGLNKDKYDARASKTAKGNSQHSIGQAVQTQNVFVGNSKDLNKLLSGQSNGETK